MTEYSMTIGIDLGDKYSAMCVIGGVGDELQVLEQSRLPMSQEALRARFEGMKPTRVAMETGTHSRWVSHLLGELGHDVIVANSRRLRMIYANENKSDQVDAEILARVARLDRTLLSEVQHRSHQSHIDLEQIKARELLVNTRTRLITHIRAVVKTFGHSLPKVDTEYFWKKTRSLLPAELQKVFGPLYELLETLQSQIKEYDRRITVLVEECYPESELLLPIKGVGPITSLAYILTVEDPHRFAKSRQVGSYFGLRPRLDQSGDHDPELSITKCGNGMVRRLLIQAAHYILGPFGEDCDLKRFGLRIASPGGKRAKRRAVVAVARKLSVLLHRLWVTGEVYDPLYNSKELKEAV